MRNKKSRMCERKKSRIHDEQRSLEEMNKLDKEISMNVYEDNKINNIASIKNSYSQC